MDLSLDEGQLEQLVHREPFLGVFVEQRVDHLAQLPRVLRADRATGQLERAPARE